MEICFRSLWHKWWRAILVRVIYSQWLATLNLTLTLSSPSYSHFWETLKKQEGIAVWSLLSIVTLFNWVWISHVIAFVLKFVWCRPSLCVHLRVCLQFWQLLGCVATDYKLKMKYWELQFGHLANAKTLHSGLYSECRIVQQKLPQQQ